ncbi:glycosyltransferase, partial [Clostridium perfringens]|nr:glycosyltransferase [Clostridium perfringens]
YDAESYFNSGVLLMNLKQMRQEINRSDIFEYIESHANILLFPDQDALNALYGHRILEIDDAQWNYDTRYMDLYYLASHRTQDIDWLVDHTKFLHF